MLRELLRTIGNGRILGGRYNRETNLVFCLSKLHTPTMLQQFPKPNGNNSCVLSNVSTMISIWLVCNEVYWYEYLRIAKCREYTEDIENELIMVRIDMTQAISQTVFKIFNTLFSVCFPCSSLRTFPRNIFQYKLLMHIFALTRATGATG